MTNYQNDIMDILQGETPRQKYEFLQELLKTFRENNKGMSECMKNLPQKIYLNIGTDQSDDFKELSEVTWSKERIGKDCIEYVLHTQPK